MASQAISKKTKVGRYSLSTAPAIYALAALSAAGIARSEVTFKPRVSTAVAWTDNIELRSNSEPKESEEILQLNPGLRVEQTAQRVQSYLDYTMQNLFFMGDSDRNKTYHSLDASTNIEALRDWFYLEAAALYSQQLVDPTRPVNNELLFSDENIANVRSARITPEVRHHLGGADLDARYTRAWVDYSGEDTNGTPIEDSTIDSAEVSLTSPDEDARMTWGVTYENDTASYETVPDFKYESARLDGSLALNNAWRLIARGGVESDFDKNPRGGGLDQPFAQAGFKYSPDTRNEIEILAGKRYDRTSYEAHWRREGRQLHWSLNYTEAPTTEAEQIALRPLGGGNTPRNPTPNSTDFARLTSEVYLDRNASAQLEIIGRRTEIKFQALQTNRIYLSSDLQEKSTEFTASVLRKLSSRTQITGSVSKQDVALREGSEYNDYLYHLTLTRILTQALNLSVTGAHVDRTGTVGGYTVNWVTLRLDAVF